MKIFSLFFLTFFLTSCGFKVINNFEFQNFYINQINTSGDNKVGFNLKNKLSLKTKDINKKKIDLDIDIDKNKTVKEKNSNNEITKYLVTINLKIIVKEENKDNITINLSQKIDYNVSSQYSQSINNEANAVKSLTNTLAEKIIEEISLIKNDS
tara:strand:- start:542 stop:1003 length:462 start_codon:yes stop_codon:yes gene_type:complete